MKRFLATALALSLFCVVSATVPAQRVMAQEKKENPKHATLPDIDKLGKEMFSAKENGIRVQVWLVRHADYKTLVGEHNEAGMYTKETTKQHGTTPQKSRATGSSSHEVAIVVLKDVVTNASIDNATVEFTFTSPTKKAATVPLAFMNGHYSNSIELTEKGSYQAELKIKRNGRTTTLNFNTPVTAS